MRSAFPLLAAAVWMGGSSPATAQEDTAPHRAVYREINEAVKSMSKVTGTHSDEPLVFALTGWMQGGELRKIVATSGEDGGGFEEYYLVGEKPVFVYNTYQQAAAEGGKGAVRVENRLYFREGRLFKWLNNQVEGGAMPAGDLAAESERLVANCGDFVEALKKKGAAAGKSQVLEGVFVGIEEGDRLHWVMRTKGEEAEERSFFILKPDGSLDEVLERPTAFFGRRCRVTWKTSTETIPEAGGAMELEQILAVEWLRGE
jgi:hypothetical protein